VGARLGGMGLAVAQVGGAWVGDLHVAYSVIVLGGGWWLVWACCGAGGGLSVGGEWGEKWGRGLGRGLSGGLIGVGGVCREGGGG